GVCGLDCLHHIIRIKRFLISVIEIEGTVASVDTHFDVLGSRQAKPHEGLRLHHLDKSRGVKVPACGLIVGPCPFQSVSHMPLHYDVLTPTQKPVRATIQTSNTKSTASISNPFISFLQTGCGRSMS